MTTTTTSGAADLPEALRSIQRFEVVDCIDDKHVPAVIPMPHGPWVRYADHVTALAAGQATAAPAAPAEPDPTPGDHPQPCDSELFESGVSVGLFDIPQWTAEALCKGIAAATGARVDWHYIGGRVHVKALPAPASAEGVAYAALPTHSHAGRVYEEGFLIGTCPLYTADKMRAFADATHALRASHGQAPAWATLPDGWVPLTITLEGQFSEEVAYGPQIMMDRLGKWLGKYFAQAADSVTAPAPPPECETEAEKRAFAFGWFKALESERMKADNKKNDPL